MNKHNFRDIIDVGLNNDAGKGIILDREALYNELEAFFSRDGDSARWLPIERAVEIYYKHRDNAMLNAA
jgi:hypothetical protein